VVFVAGDEKIRDVKRRIDDEVLPRFSKIPHFLGFVALQSEGSRPEVVALSFWDDGLEGSEAISEEFRDEIERVTGAALARKEFTIVRMLMRGTNRAVYLDMSLGKDVAEHRCSSGHRLIDDQSQTARKPIPAWFCPTCNAPYTKQPDGTFVRVTDRSSH
jgi:hypothetical protein